MRRGAIVLAFAVLQLIGCGGGGGGDDLVQPAGDSAFHETSPRDVARDLGLDTPKPQELPDSALPDSLDIAEVLTPPDLNSDAEISACTSGCFLEPCREDLECASGPCVQDLGELVCSRPCGEGCPTGWECDAVAGLCRSAAPTLGLPCTSDSGCGIGTGSLCLTYGPQGSFCGADCGESSLICPEGYSCLAVEGVERKQCVADSGECNCTEHAIESGLESSCFIENEHGTCYGARVCLGEGLSPCDAVEPGPDFCNGVDDDCDGEVDELPCDDGNPCTADSCVEGLCRYLAEDGPACDDQDPCTEQDGCLAGSCAGTPLVCWDDNPCTDDVCDNGACEFTPNQEPCDDQDPCTGEDSCREGLCQGVPLDCACQEDGDCLALEDQDLCNGTLVCDRSELPYTCRVDPDSVVQCPGPGEGIDSACLVAACEPLTGLCSLIPGNDGGFCDDGDLCTTLDRCAQGKCTGSGISDCNDNNPCTDDGCEAELGCVHQNNSEPCSDGDACTFGDMCGGGVCVPGAVVSCEDFNPCTEDLCDPAQGCSSSPKSGACDDQNSCTYDDECDQGVCRGLPRSCDDGNVCTDDLCDPLSGCLFQNNSLPCDDGDACTAGDHCSAGSCSGIQVTCDDADPCTLDICDPGSGCLYPSNEALCDDHDRCTFGDVCADGLCRGQPAVCDDENPCTDDACDSGFGCVYIANISACDDGDPCTLDDRCGDGACEGAGVLNCDDGNPCTTDSCQPGSGCRHDNNSLACDDQDPCTPVDTCTLGVCQGLGQLSCDDGNPCTDDGCVPGEGCSHTFNDSACDDNSTCTTGDVCRQGVCLGQGELSCDDGNPCTRDICNLDSGCGHEPVTGACDDGNPCTEGDSCLNGSCASGSLKNCDDGNPCTADSCGLEGTCRHEPRVGACDDLNFCTVGDYCVGGVCLSQGQLDCNDLNPCTDDVCQPSVGCVHLDNSEPCNDGDRCTVGDLCVSGACRGGASPDCDDDNPCTDDRCDPFVGCITDANLAPCSDGDLCTGDDVCRDSQCISGEPVFCDDGNLCTRDLCVPSIGCVFEADDSMGCDDGDACTINACDSGLCRIIEVWECGNDCGECNLDQVCTAHNCVAAYGSNCENQFIINEIPYQYLGSTALAADDFKVAAASCDGSNPSLGDGSPDQVFGFEPETGGIYTFQLTSGFQAAAYLLNDCDSPDSSCISWVGPGTWSVWDVTLSAGQPVYLVVDGTGPGTPSSGNYRVSITLKCASTCDGSSCGGDGCGGTCECEPDDVCLPSLSCCHPIDCSNRECGDDGCGGSCGSCGDRQVCISGGCCTPECDGTRCDSDHCGGFCSCPVGVPCNSEGACCNPQCDGKDCGNDGCGGTCGDCPDGLVCLQEGTCCELTCGSAVCGEDGCGGTCGVCPEDQVCHGGECCTPQCGGLECGDDSCGGSCGVCPEGQPCLGGECCEPQCEGKDCGPDGCGGTCGSCSVGSVCISGSCCTGSCDGRECGDDGCGASCGACPQGETCKAGGLCCLDCSQLECGDDGCGNSCGQCPNGDVCRDNSCCTLDCAGKECGSDGCGGQCGDCGPYPAWCDWDSRCHSCWPDCRDKTCGDPDGCGGTCDGCRGVNEACDGSQCLCLPECDGRECGPDGCGGSCGDCGSGYLCLESGSCGIDGCAGLECGEDELGNSCGACPEGEVCLGQGICCLPTCDGAECGDDGCGGTCGDCCGYFKDCVDGTCDCLPDCENRVCGDDGCGGSCGECDPGFNCSPGGTCNPPPACQPPNEVQVFCGDFEEGRTWRDLYFQPVSTGIVTFTALDSGNLSGDGASISACEDGAQAEIYFLNRDEGRFRTELTFVAVAGRVYNISKDEWSWSLECGSLVAPDCQGKTCGDGNYGFSCGTCGAGEVCTEGNCCAPSCSGECEPDGCGGWCPGSSLELWVDSSSTSETRCGTQDDPYLEIGEALAAAEPGAIIHVLPGTYEESLVVDKQDVQLLGSESDPVYIRGDFDQNSTNRYQSDTTGISVRAPGVMVENISIRDFRTGLVVDSTYDVTLAGLDVSRCETGISVNESSAVSLRDSLVHDGSTVPLGGGVIGVSISSSCDIEVADVVVSSIHGFSGDYLCSHEIRPGSAYGLAFSQSQRVSLSHLLVHDVYGGRGFDCFYCGFEGVLSDLPDITGGAGACLLSNESVFLEIEHLTITDCGSGAPGLDEMFGDECLVNYDLPTGSIRGNSSMLFNSSVITNTGCSENLRFANSCIRGCDDQAMQALHSIAGNPEFDAGFHLGAESPCLAAGDPCSDCLNEPGPNGCRENPGYWGDTDQATSPVGWEHCEADCHERPYCGCPLPDGAECGLDVCGFWSVDCPDGEGCLDGQCISCQDACFGDGSGPDSCSCPQGAFCHGGQCVDCGGSCFGENEFGDKCTCGAGEFCASSKLCETCSCDGKSCGDDGCGNSCGLCPQDASCFGGQCWAPNCRDGMCLVPAGEFIFGDEPRWEFYLDAFMIDEYPATEEEVAACRAAGACTVNLVVTPLEPAEVVYNQAEAYCTWRGKRLCTSPEWEYAARGSDARTYPWGEDCIPNPWYYDSCYPDNTCSRYFRLGDQIGSMPEASGPSGIQDPMIGPQWTSTWYERDYWWFAPGVNPEGPENGVNKVVRGLTSERSVIHLAPASCFDPAFYGSYFNTDYRAGVRCCADLQ